MGRFAVLLVVLLAACTELVGPRAVACHYEFTRLRIATEAERVLYLNPIRANPENSCTLLSTTVEPIPWSLGDYQAVETWECRTCNDPAPD